MGFRLPSFVETQQNVVSLQNPNVKEFTGFSASKLGKIETVIADLVQPTVYVKKNLMRGH